LQFTRKSVKGIGFCLCAAGILSLIMRDQDSRLAAPLLCTFAVMATSFVWGRAAAILGGICATLIFDLFLFPPIGHFRVSDPAERLALVLLAWSVVMAALMSPPDPRASGAAGRGKDFRQGS